MTAPMGPQDHATLSPSGAHRWMSCPGSVEAEAPYPDSSSKYADEGSAAHLLAEHCLTDPERGDAEAWIGHTFPEWPGFPVTADMAEAVQVYLDYVRGVWVFCDRTWTERNVPLNPRLFVLPDPTVGQGTSDAGGVDLTGGVLHVSDLKFGRGVIVEAEENEQFRLYALAAYGDLPVEERLRVTKVVYHVVQPRAEHDDGPCRTWEEEVEALLEWGVNVMVPAAHQAMREGQPRSAGDHCRFCKAKGACDTFRNRALDAMPFDFGQVGGPTVLPAVTNDLDVEAWAPQGEVIALTPERVAEVYFGLERLEEWIKAFRAFVFAELEAGRDIPGVALKRKRTNRKWIDEEMVRQYIDSTVTESIAAECYDTKPLSVAQLEKVAKRHPKYLTFPEHLVVKQDGDLTLCAADDPGALTVAPVAANRFNFEELP